MKTANRVMGNGLSLNYPAENGRSYPTMPSVTYLDLPTILFIVLKGSCLHLVINLFRSTGYQGSFSFSSMLTLLALRLATARSRSPSPSQSPTANALAPS